MYHISMTVDMIDIVVVDECGDDVCRFAENDVAAAALSCNMHLTGSDALTQEDEPVQAHLRQTNRNRSEVCRVDGVKVKDLITVLVCLQQRQVVVAAQVIASKPQQSSSTECSSGE